MRTAIYARYSSNNQRDASIDDQIRLCRARIDQEGWILASTYSDRAISGATTLRPGYQKLLEDARAGAFDLVLAEGLDRLSRDLEAIASLFKHLTFSGIRLVTLADGEISELHVGLKGTMNALYLKDLAQKTWRGLEGRVRAGRSGGGLSYGYDAVLGTDGEPGERNINEPEAAIVVRMFREFAAGRAPREIAIRLNKEGIPGPRGGTWGPSSIYGNWRRGTGILNNELYIGRLVWNRQRFIKDPTTGRRQARPNPESEWIVEQVPHLQIVPQDLWDEVKERQKTTRRRIAQGREGRSERARRPVYLFSGLIKCAACGGGFSIISANHYGCSNARNRGTCSNRTAVRRDVLEESVLSGLKEQLMEPDLVKEFIAEYHRELNRLRANAEQDGQMHLREIAKIDREIGRLVQAIKDGVQASSVGDELERLEAQKGRLESAVQRDPEPTPRLHPNLAELYRKKVANLREALNQIETRSEAALLIRELVQEIKLHPIDGALQIELVGDLARILSLASKNPRRGDATGVQLTLVAGARYQRYLQLARGWIPHIAIQN